MKNEQKGILETAWYKLKLLLRSPRFKLVVCFFSFFLFAVTFVFGTLVNLCLASDPSFWESGFELPISFIWFLSGISLCCFFSFFGDVCFLLKDKSQFSAEADKNNKNENKE